eukprot:3267312-Amphidinium_carterae.1
MCKKPLPCTMGFGRRPIGESQCLERSIVDETAFACASSSARCMVLDKKCALFFGRLGGKGCFQTLLELWIVLGFGHLLLKELFAERLL